MRGLGPLLRRHRLLAAFLAADAVLGCLVLAGAAGAVLNGALAPLPPLPTVVAAAPTLPPTLPGADEAATRPPPPPPETATPTEAGAGETRRPVVSETLVGAATATASLSPTLAAATATPSNTRVLSTGTQPQRPTNTPALTPSQTLTPSAVPSGSHTQTPTPSLTVPAATATRTPTSTPTRTSTSTTPPPATQGPPPPAAPGGFVGMNGGPLEGNNSAFPYQGNLSHNPMLRAASFGWLARAGVQWYRNYGSDGINHSWVFVEPAPGQFDWAAWDILVTAAQNQQLNLLASIGNSVPAWANGTTNWRQPPSDLHVEPMENTAWYRFVTALVERYDGDGQGDMPGLARAVKHWEVWNEPELRQGWNAPDYPAHQFNGSATDYARLLAVAYTAIKRADPGAVVVGPATAQVPGFGYNAAWTMWDWGSFVTAGGLNYLDIVSFHVYFDRTSWDPNGHLDGALNQVDANRGGKPVWLTEIGWDGNPTSDHADKARNLVRSAVSVWARPFMDRYFWYSWQESETHEGSSHKGLLQTTSGVAAVGAEPDPLFHPAYRALEVMNRVLAGYGPGERPAALNVGAAARAYQFAAGGREVWVAWNRPASGATTISLDTGGRTVRMIGLYGEDLGTFAGGTLVVGPDPIYLTTDLNWNPNLGRIAGRVRSAALGAQWGNGAAGVTVQLAGPAAASTTTNADGNYVFEGLPEGTYTVSVTGAGSQLVTVGRTLPWGRTSFTLP